ncbi:MAG TPA: fibronectin type III domain-containing protein [Streptosporangiaceae bacterium]|nr:fibronectin type III domain-containing protein [Streptosporangiaceae bacterium]
MRGTAASAAARTAAGDGTPEQVHLTWGDDPATSVVVSWASPGRAIAPRVLLDGPGAGRRVIPGLARSYTDGLNGETVWTYHAVIAGLRPDTGYSYAVTAGNDSVFDLDPGERGGETTITVSYHHAVGADPANPATGAAGAPNPHYTEFETFTLVRPRSDGPGSRPRQAFSHNAG